MADASLEVYLSTPHRLLLKYVAATGPSDVTTATLSQADLLAACVDAVAPTKGVAPLKAAIAAFPVVADDAAALDAAYKPDQGLDAKAYKKPSVVKRRLRTSVVAGTPVPVGIAFVKGDANKPALVVEASADALIEVAVVHTVNG